MQDLAQGFVQTPTQVLVFFLIIAGLLLFFSLSYVLRKRRAERELTKRGSVMLDHRLDELALGEDQLRLLARLARYLDTIDGEYALVLNRHVFDECARRLHESEGVPEAALEALRKRIDFRVSEGEDEPVTSAELPSGSTLVFAVRRGGVLRGTLGSQGPRGMTIQMAEGSRRLPPGTPLAAYYHNSLGVFSFTTRVLEESDGSVLLTHSTALIRHQRRAFYRLNVSLPVFTASTLSAAAPGESVLLNLSPGGASLLKQGLPVQRGDLIELSFSPAMEGLALLARVLRITRGGKVLNVRFESVTETQRKRIIRFLRRRIFASLVGERPAEELLKL
jgi:hypothetical protein